MAPCKKCKQNASSKGDWIYCDDCVEHRYSMAARHRSCICINMRRGCCMAVSGIHNPGEKIDRYSWLKTGYVIYSADNNGFIILGDFCSDCDRYIRYLRLEKRRVSRSLSDLAEDINRQSEKLRELLVHAERTEENIKRLRIKHSELYIDNSRYDDLLSTYDDKDYLVMNTRFVVGSNNQDLDTMSRKRSREENDQRYYKSANQEEIPAPSAKRVRYFEIKKEDEDYIPL